MTKQTTAGLLTVAATIVPFGLTALLAALAVRRYRLWCQEMPEAQVRRLEDVRKFH